MHQSVLPEFYIPEVNMNSLGLTLCKPSKFFSSGLHLIHQATTLSPSQYFSIGTHPNLTIMKLLLFDENPKYQCQKKKKGSSGWFFPQFWVLMRSFPFPFPIIFMHPRGLVARSIKSLTKLDPFFRKPNKTRSFHWLHAYKLRAQASLQQCLILIIITYVFFAAERSATFL